MVQKWSYNSSRWSKYVLQNLKIDTDWLDVNIVELLAQLLKLSTTPKQKHKQNHYSNLYHNQTIMKRQKEGYWEVLALQTLQTKAEAIHFTFFYFNKENLVLELVSNQTLGTAGQGSLQEEAARFFLYYCIMCTKLVIPVSLDGTSLFIGRLQQRL